MLLLSFYLLIKALLTNNFQIYNYDYNYKVIESCKDIQFAGIINIQNKNSSNMLLYAHKYIEVQLIYIMRYKVVILNNR